MERFTDDEIIKALECCSSGITADTCKECPLNAMTSGSCYYDDTVLERYALQVIKRLKEDQGKMVKRVLEKVYDHTTSKEVGMKWILMKIAEEEGVKLDRELKKYGERGKKT